MDEVMYMADDDMETRYYEVRAMIKIEAYLDDTDSILKESIKEALIGEHDLVIDDEEAVFDIESISITRKK
jgi:hypothetical protein